MKGVTRADGIVIGKIMGLHEHRVRSIQMLQ
jgi:hypothetical protein